MKIFISQPMKNRTNEEIEIERKKIIDEIKKKYVCVEIIDSFMKNAPKLRSPLENLSKSIGFLATANLAVFPTNYKDYRGCAIEHECATQYNIAITYYKVE